ncbi:YxiG-like protein [Catellatospora tritici]
MVGEVGIAFHEAAVETECHRLRLIFADLVVAPVATGLSPFVVTD